jgi:thiamine biosynthesis lipoprotein
LLLPSIERAGAAGNLARFEQSEPHMGTLVRVVVYASSLEAASKGTGQAFDRVREIDQTLSDYRAESELNRLSQQAGGLPVKVGSDLFRVLSASQSLAVRSRGAFDVTAGPLTLLWRRARRQRALPEAHRVAAALCVTGFRLLALDAARQTAWLAKTGMQLDVGGMP